MVIYANVVVCQTSVDEETVRLNLGLGVQRSEGILWDGVEPIIEPNWTEKYPFKMLLNHKNVDYIVSACDNEVLCIRPQPIPASIINPAGRWSSQQQDQKCLGKNDLSICTLKTI